MLFTETGRLGPYPLRLAYLLRSVKLAPCCLVHSQPPYPQHQFQALPDKP